METAAAVLLLTFCNGQSGNRSSYTHTNDTHRPLSVSSPGEPSPVTYLWPPTPNKNTITHILSLYQLSSCLFAGSSERHTGPRAVLTVEVRKCTHLQHIYDRAERERATQLCCVITHAHRTLTLRNHAPENHAHVPIRTQTTPTY